MKTILCFLLVLLAAALPALAIDQAMPKHHAGSLPANHADIEEPAAPSLPLAQDRPAFRQAINLSVFRLLAIQHEEQLKIVNSWASQSIRTIAHRSNIDGQDPVYTAMDMCFRPEYWVDQNVIYVQAVPLRQQLSNLVEDSTERDRILYKATVSPRFMLRDDVQQLLSQISMNDSARTDAVNKLQGALMTFLHLGETLRVLPPEQRDAPWHVVVPDLVPNVAEFKARALEVPGMGIDAQTPPLTGYTETSARPILEGMRALMQGWRDSDAAVANQGLSQLAAALPTAQPAYPSPLRRQLELWYTRTFSGTLIGVVYFAAMVLFLIAAAGAAPKARTWAMGFFTLALICHILAMAVRWYLAGRIPIQNQFESILGSALGGCIIGWALELWRKNGLFGMAMSFVGFVAMTACLVVPFVYGKSIGENVSPVAGILMTFWLYIHVNIVICSYALIAASFALGAAYLGVRLWHWINPAEEPGTAAVDALLASRRNVLEGFDAANVIVMRLAFLFLGSGIVFGAVWANESWGPPLGLGPQGNICTCHLARVFDPRARPVCRPLDQGSGHRRAQRARLCHHAL